jgi:hypothetical protein
MISGNWVICSGNIRAGAPSKAGPGNASILLVGRHGRTEMKQLSIREKRDLHGHIILVDEDESEIARVNALCVDAEANAKLLASAPKLLATLQRISNGACCDSEGIIKQIADEAIAQAVQC